MSKILSYPRGGKTPRICNGYTKDKAISYSDNAGSGSITISPDPTTMAENLVGSLFYVCNLVSGTTYRIRTGQYTMCMLFLHNVDGEQVASSNMEGNEYFQYIDYTPISSGLYYVEFTDSTSRTLYQTAGMGLYDSLTITPEPAAYTTNGLITVIPTFTADKLNFISHDMDPDVYSKDPLLVFKLDARYGLRDISSKKRRMNSLYNQKTPKSFLITPRLGIELNALLDVPSSVYDYTPYFLISSDKKHLSYVCVFKPNESTFASNKILWEISSYRMRITATGFQLSWDDNSSGWDKNIDFTVADYIGKWTEVKLIYDDSDDNNSGNLNVYINNVLVYSSTTAKQYYEEYTYVRLGCGDSRTGDFELGSFSFYNKTLSESERTALYNYNTKIWSNPV